MAATARYWPISRITRSHRGSVWAARSREMYTGTSRSSSRRRAVSSAENPYRGLISTESRGMSWLGLSITRSRDSITRTSAAWKNPPATEALAGTPWACSCWA